MLQESIDRAVQQEKQKRYEKWLKQAENANIKRRRPSEHKVKVQNATRKMIADGELYRTACVICGDTPTETHHPTYDLNHPDRVVFLCRYHHSVAHYYKQLHEKGEIASITQNCVRKYHKDYKKTHIY